MNLFSFGKTPTYTLLIPISNELFEENKDLIFSRLSINEKILSVKKIDKKIILEELNKKIDSELISDDLVPEVFEITIKKKNYLDLEKENKKIKEVIEGAEIFENNVKLKNSMLLSFLYVFTLVLFFLIIVYFMQMSFINKINTFLVKSRVFGSKDIELIFNVSLGYFLFQFIGIFSGYFSIYFLEHRYDFTLVSLIKNTEVIIFFFFAQNFICILGFTYNLKKQIRKVI